MKKNILPLIFTIVLASCNSYSKNYDTCQSGNIALYSIDHSQSPLSKSISLININNKKITDIKTNGVFQIAFAPQGDKVAFSELYLDTNGVDLVLLDISTRQTSRFKNKFDDYHPVWSPNGEELLYISGPEFSFELYKLDIKQMTYLPVSLPFSDDYGYIVPVDWKQDGILFRGQSNSEANSSNDKLIFFSNTSEWNVIYESPSNISTALLSPTEAILLIEEGGNPKDSQNPPSIFFYDWENNKKISIPEIQGWSRSPDWSPDGKCIVYLYNNEIRIYSLESKIVSTFYTFLDKNIVISDLRWE